MIYLDNAATSHPKPPEVIEALVRAVTKYGGNPGRSAHALSLATAEAVYSVRESIADFIGAPSPENIIFTMNATYALNMAIKSFVRPGMHVLISNREHNAVLRPIARLAEEGVITYDVFPLETPPEEGILPLVRQNTSLVIVDLVSNVDGLSADLPSLLRFSKARGLSLIVDASQALGHQLLPLKKSDFLPEESALYAICAPCHKGLFGVQGAGFAYFTSRPEKTFVEGGSGSASLSPRMPESLPERMEAGTVPTPAILAAGAGIDFLRRVSVKAIEEKEEALTERSIDRLRSLKNVTLHLPSGRRCGGILSFTAGEISSESVAAALDRKGIAVRAGFHCAPLAHKSIGTLRDGTVRVSFGYYNTAEDVDRLYQTLKEILGI